MKTKGFLRIIIILLVLGLNIGCDQVSKSLVRRKMYYYTQIGFLHNHITISKVENTGAFLSLGDTYSRPVKMVLFNILPLLAVAVGLGFILIKTNLDKVTLLCMILIVGGGFGNIYDRISRGSVTDFMHINFGIFQTGIFNVADVSITTGTLILLVYAYFKKPEVVEESKAV
jgi:signal peptidase II